MDEIPGGNYTFIRFLLKMFLVMLVSLFQVLILFNLAMPIEMKNPFNIPWYRKRIEGYQTTKIAFTTLYRDRYLGVDWCGNNVLTDSQEGYGRHTGIDIAVVSGTNVIAPWYGKIIYAGDRRDGWGGLVIMECKGLPGLAPDEVRYFIWAHNENWYVKKDDIISESQFLNPQTDTEGSFLTYRKGGPSGEIVGGIIIAKSGGGKNDPHNGTSTGAHSHFQGDKKEGDPFPYWPSTPSWVKKENAYKYFLSDILENQYTPANIPDDLALYIEKRTDNCFFPSKPPELTETTYYNNGEFPITLSTFNPLEFIQDRTNIGKFDDGREFGEIRDPSTRIMYSDFFLYGGYEYFGFPTNRGGGLRVHKAWNRWSQDFAGGKTGQTMFVWNELKQRSYPVTMGFLDLYWWMNQNGYDSGAPMEEEKKTIGFSAIQRFQNEETGSPTYEFHYDDSTICAWATNVNNEELLESRRCWDERKREAVRIFIRNHFESGIGGGGFAEPTLSPPSPPTNMRIIGQR